MPDLPTLAEYLSAKHAWEDEVLKLDYFKLTQQQRDEFETSSDRINAMKTAYGEPNANDPLCCQRYGRLHEPAFSVTGCRWRDAMP